MRYFLLRILVHWVKQDIAKHERIFGVQHHGHERKHHQAECVAEANELWLTRIRIVFAAAAAAAAAASGAR